MADEEKNETTEETPAEDDSTAGPVAADDSADSPEDGEPGEPPAAPPADEAAPAAGPVAADDSPDSPEDGEPAEPPAAPPADEAAADDEASEELSPKQKRKVARSTFSGEAAPSRTDEERAADRVARRRKAKESRSRVRARSRQAKGEPRPGTPPAEREPGQRKIRQGTVVSDKADKTITVEVELARRHPAYEKVVRRSRKLHAHDEGNEARQGDVVRLIETRPLSRTKRWRLAEIVERAPTR